MDALLGYESSESEPESSKSSKRKLSEEQSRTVLSPPKKRKLPALSTSFIPTTPVSDPTKHQGRIRTNPHVEGQFASYVYIPVPIESGSTLSRIIAKSLKEAQDVVPSIYPIVPEMLSSAKDTDSLELHISLTRPVYLRHHQRDAFRDAVRKVAVSNSTFTASFATFATFDNDEKTRAFVALEVGAGHSELYRLTEALTPILRSLYQKEYYVEPRFHASFAWALLKSGVENESEHTPASLGDTDIQRVQTEPNNETFKFPTMPQFPPELSISLTERLGERLRLAGSFDVTEIKVRIGKDIRSYTLQGSA
ncbi:hypothetical protein M422DRAFT_775091 [Sphaerobolus stellatus SS14]|nr:hypothetical protein M422DRAFT_775091 [Sphaerobolus stellatus SS14]